MTSPSFRTKRLVETPTLAVWGATGLPISAPTEFRVGSSKGGKPSSLPTSIWKWPNIALVEVLLPDSATPIQPRIGATTTKAGPILAKALASEPAMPEKLKTLARPKMKMPTSSAPHIWPKVLRKISPSCAGPTLSSSATITQDARIAVPPDHGVNLKLIATGWPSIASWAETPACHQTVFGRSDHGPVQATTTTIRTMKGSQAAKTSAGGIRAT